MNRITKMWKDERYLYNLKWFIIWVVFISFLALVYEMSIMQVQINDLRIDLRKATNKIESIQSIIDVVSGVEEIKQKEK